MVSRNFLIQQATLNALQELMPTTMRLDGPVGCARGVDMSTIIDREDHYFVRCVRKHFNTLDRKAREQQDVIRFEDWRAISGNFK